MSLPVDIRITVGEASEVIRRLEHTGTADVATSRLAAPRPLNRSAREPGGPMHPSSLTSPAAVPVTADSRDGALPSVSVVLTGVGPVFGRGLTDALCAAGVPTALVRDPATVALAAQRSRARLVVAALPAFARVRQDVQERLGAAAVRLAVLVDGEDPERYRHGLRLGAHTVVPITSSPARMVTVLAAAARGYRLVPAAAARALCQGVVGVSAVQVPERELGWLRLVADGVTVAELARRSAYSEREMYRLLGATYRRLGAETRTEALIAAQRAGLLTVGTS